MEDLYRLLWGLGNTWRRGRKSSELEDGGCATKDASVYGTAGVLMDLVPPWFLNKTTARLGLSIFYLEERGIDGFHLSPRDYWQLMVSGEEGVTSLRGVLTDHLPTLQK